MLLHRFDEHPYPWERDPRELRAQRRRLLAGDAPRAPVGDPPFAIHSAEVAARRHVLRLQVEVDAQRFEHAAADAIPDRVIPEQRQMPRPAARCHAVRHRHRHAADALQRQPVETRDVRLLEFRTTRLVRQTAEPVDDDEEDLGVVGYRQLAQQFKIHDAILTEAFRTRTSVQSHTALH